MTRLYYAERMPNDENRLDQQLLVAGGRLLCDIAVMKRNGAGRLNHCGPIQDEDWDF